MEQLLQGVLSGLAFGSLYALIAQGYYVTHITTNILNFALGEFLMIGAMVGLALYVTFGLPLPLVFAVIVALEAVMGVVLQRVAAFYFTELENSYAARFLNVVRNEFGGHAVVKKG